ncbi:hypothetical protein PO883_14055 [Massilia sp. DJPM01]|uniref:hypothetical protein n=1 Tax=Massilia sp. DJPM01 TaxID=3024404 RepID=UPI00259DB854|nr:hypothetical protein [Massilia sp. DJPM01]MDM5178318.1 hypothetical protein [Massilia sp. DJPM01]
MSHVGKDTWRVDYRFSQAVTAVELETVGDYRQKAWKMLTPAMRLEPASQFDRISADGKPFTTASIQITTFDGMAPKSYAPFNRFTDGGTAVFLGNLQGNAYQDQQAFAMSTDIRLKGLAKENVIAPPLNKLVPGGARGYAYFGPAQPVRSGSTQFLLDPDTPAWMREVAQDVGAKVSAYYEKAYRRALKEGVFVMLSVSGFEEKGLAMKGGAVMGQLSYRFDGQKLLADHPTYREVLARLVAHEIAHLWQLNVSRGGIGENDPWIHEGGAEAMAIDALLKTGIWSPQSAANYRAQQSASCEKLGNSVASFDGIYACGLMRFDRLGIDIVPLWRSMIQTSEAKGEVYSERMIEAIAGGAGGALQARAKHGGAGE